MDQLQIQTLLETLMGDEPDNKLKVYFQPPSNVQMTYPCLVYNVDNAVTLFASNKPYRYTKRYQVTVIDRDPNSEIPDKVATLPMCTFDRFYAAENLNHSVFDVYF